jgi:hypothetical protein
MGRLVIFRYRKAKQNFGTVPVQALLLLGKIFDDIYPYQISTNIMAGIKSYDAIDSRLMLLFGYRLLCASGLTCNAHVNFLQMYEEDKQVRIKHAQLLCKICFFERLGKAELDRSPSWLGFSGEFGPDGCDHAQKLALIKLKRELPR